MHAEETTKVETIRGDTTAITGKRLRLMAASHPVWMPFDQDMVKLEIPTKFLFVARAKRYGTAPGRDREKTGRWCFYPDL